MIHADEVVARRSPNNILESWSAILHCKNTRDVASGRHEILIRVVLVCAPMRSAPILRLDRKTVPNRSGKIWE